MEGRYLMQKDLETYRRSFVVVRSFEVLVVMVRLS